MGLGTVPAITMAQGTMLQDIIGDLAGIPTIDAPTGEIDTGGMDAGTGINPYRILMAGRGFTPARDSASRLIALLSLARQF
jgi:hypothetical protein